MGEGKKLVFALAGNQNSGKTTLFNQLTGASQHVGNFPGVTVERHEGRIKGHEFVELVDLPGIYSLSPYSGEEMITRDMLIGERPDAIINIVDAMNIERNLYLTLQLMELSIPLVISLNMMDEMRANGNEVDIRALSARLGVPVIPISASKNEGLHELVDAAIDAANERLKPSVTDFCAGPVHRCIHSIAHIVEDHAEKIGIPNRFAATKLVEGDAPITGKLSLNENELETVEHLVREMEHEIGTDREAALADMRYKFIERVIGETVNKRARSRERARSAAADRVLTHRVFALPIFMAIMFCVFWLTFGVVGVPLSDVLGEAIGTFNEAVGDLLEMTGINPVFRRFVTEGILTGVGTVVTFIPVIATLFLLLSLLEDSGYMARIAFVMDKPHGSNLDFEQFRREAVHGGRLRTKRSGVFVPYAVAHFRAARFRLLAGDHSGDNWNNGEGSHYLDTCRRLGHDGRRSARRDECHVQHAPGFQFYGIRTAVHAMHRRNGHDKT